MITPLCVYVCVCVWFKWLSLSVCLSDECFFVLNEGQVTLQSDSDPIKHPSFSLSLSSSSFPPFILLTNQDLRLCASGPLDSDQQSSLKCESTSVNEKTKKTLKNKRLFQIITGFRRGDDFDCLWLTVRTRVIWSLGHTPAEVLLCMHAWWSNPLSYDRNM